MLFRSPGGLRCPRTLLPRHADRFGSSHHSVPRTVPRRIFVAKKKPKARFTAKNSDRHDLYQRRVQAPEFEVAVFDRTFRKLRKRLALSMREDFCGTASVSTPWVGGRRD